MVQEIVSQLAGHGEPESRDEENIEAVISYLEGKIKYKS